MSAVSSDRASASSLRRKYGVPAAGTGVSALLSTSVVPSTRSATTAACVPMSRLRPTMSVGKARLPVRLVSTIVVRGSSVGGVVGGTTGRATDP